MNRTREETLLQPAMIEKLERLGYYLLPRTHDASPGHTGLLILLRPRPHPAAVSDPQSLHLRLESRDGGVHWTTFDADTPFSQTRMVAPGPIHVFEHGQAQTAFFTFGGTLAAETVDTGVVYSLYSSAPILCLTREQSTFGSHLAVEVEAFLAQEQIHSQMDDTTFLRQLVEVDPHALYVTVLDSLLAHYQQSAALKQGHLDFYQALQREKKWLEQTGQWPVSVPSISNLLNHTH